MDQIANLVIDLGIDAAEFKNEIPRIKNLLNGAAGDAERSSARMQRFMERQTQAARQTMQAASSAVTAASAHAQTVEKNARAHERMAREVEQTRLRVDALNQKMREEQAQARALAEAQDKAAAAFYRQIDSVKQAGAGLQELQRIQQQIRQARNSGGVGQQDYLALISEITAKTRALTQAEEQATRQKAAFIRQLKEQATRQNLSSSELLRARAAQLGVSSAAEVYIRKMERAGKATHSLGLKSAAARRELGGLHRFLGLEFPRQKKTIGVVFGKFYPLHTGHIYLIQRACSQVDELHIIMGFDDTRDRALFEDSAMSQQPTVPDRLRWLLQTFKYQKNIRIHAFNEEGMEPYPHGWDVWSNGIKKFMAEKGIQPDLIYTSEEADAPQYMEHLGIDTVLVDPKRTFMSISGAQIRENPFRYWEYIPTEVKPFFVRTVAILGGESSGKSTLVNKLANIFNTTSAWEYGRDYVFSHLGGDEIALQYSDYDKIALGHAQYIDFAVKYANKVAFIDTDFVTTQAFCKKYEGREHPFVQALIDEYRFDLVILLENNTPWVADGLRSLGSSVDRKEFQNLLVEMLEENNIEFVRVEEDDYDSRFLRCVELVREMMGEQR